MTELKVLHWNILAEISADNTEMGFPHTPPVYLNWENHRKQKVIEMIRDEDPDIMGLVEVDKQQLNDLKKEFSSKYHIEHYFKYSKNENGEFKEDSTKEGSMILIKKSIIESYNNISFNIEGYSQICNGIYFIIDRIPVIFLSLHLKAKSNFTQNRINQVRSVKKLLNSFQRDKFGIFNQSRIIIAGDFNDDPDSVPIKMMLDNYQMISDRSRLTTFKRRLVYKKTTIDYIFGSHNVKVVNSDVPKEYLAHAPQCQENAFPCEEFPSDHLYLTAKVKLY